MPQSDSDSLLVRQALQMFEQMTGRKYGQKAPNPTQKSEALRRLVESGDITQATADSILGGVTPQKAEEPKLSEYERLRGRLPETARATTDSIRAGLKPRATSTEPRATQKSEALDRLRARGAITQAQADSAQAGLKKEKPGKTTKERRIDLANRLGKIKPILDSGEGTEQYAGEPFGAPQAEAVLSLVLDRGMDLDSVARLRDPKTGELVYPMASHPDATILLHQFIQEEQERKTGTKKKTIPGF